MTEKAFESITPGAFIGQVRVQEGAALADYTARKGIIEDRASALAAKDARSYTLEDGQIGKTAVEVAFEDIDAETGKATVYIHEHDQISPNLLQPFVRLAMENAGVHRAQFGQDASNVPVEELREVGFHPISPDSEVLAFAA